MVGIVCHLARVEGELCGEYGGWWV
jgi:hypothetical protein